MKKISVLIPCYNEENSVEEMYQRLKKIFDGQLKDYLYEIIYVDDFSTDSTRDEIRKLCGKDGSVKGVFNAKNFGFHRNVFECFRYASGDCAFMVFGDLQDPPEMLPAFVEKWKEGYKCIVGQKKKSDEGWVMTQFRKMYYRMINMLGDKKQIQFMNGFGLYDREFLDAINRIEETAPYFKTVISEYGMDLAIVPYEHAASRRGKSNFNFLRNYDFAMHGLTSSTKMLMRVATFLGVLIGTASVVFAVYVCINKLIHWESYPIGMASIMVGIFFLGAIQLFFIGVLGEYILSINERVTKKPRVVVGEKLNFEDTDEEIKNVK